MENELTYTRRGDYLYPDLIPEEQPERPLGKYGRMRRAYLEESHPGQYNRLILSGKLLWHCLEIQEAAESRMELLMPRLAEAAGATEQLKVSNPMKWVGLMNACKAQAEEIIRTELIYS